MELLTVQRMANDKISTSRISGDEQQVVLITGASSGIGRSCATYLAEKGYKVYGTTRNRQGFEDSNSKLPFNSIFMDVNDIESVNSAIEKILASEQRLDAVINNAGFGIGGPVEFTSIEEAKAQFDTNLFGIMRVCSAVLPAMRSQGAGYIINISSLGGLIGLPFQGLYSATKFAVEGLSEALYGELRSQGIRVVLIEPGDFATAFTKNRKQIAKPLTDTNYATDFQRTLSVIESDEMNGANPIKIAQLIDKILRTPNPRLRYRVGSFSQKLSVVLKKIIPDRLFAWIIMDHYQVGKSDHK